MLYPLLWLAEISCRNCRFFLLLPSILKTAVIQCSSCSKSLLRLVNLFFFSSVKSRDERKVKEEKDFPERDNQPKRELLSNIENLGNLDMTPQTHSKGISPGNLGLWKLLPKNMMLNMILTNSVWGPRRLCHLHSNDKGKMWWNECNLHPEERTGARGRVLQNDPLGTLFFGPWLIWKADSRSQRRT